MTNVESPTKTLRPSRELYKKAVRRDLLVSGPLFVILMVSQIGLAVRASARGDDSDRWLLWFYGAVMAAAVAFAFVYYFSVMRNLRIDVGATSLVATNGAGRARTVNYSDVAAVIQPLLQLPARTVPILFLLDSSGKRILTMYGTVWLPESMVAVASATGVPPTTFPEAISYRGLRKLYPNAVSWARANPMALAVILAAGLIVVFIVVVVVLFVTLSSSFR
jgi:hypothetical protein